ncbi:glutamate--tRNA ligase [Candidatus Woesearchaeota archaeon]|mgnify:CR=1 FL=1|nr:glutamate--tRNA ligase [Candidatus Woesearchaeota archaeon]
MNIRKWVLHNALQFNGKASAGAVIGKVIQEDAQAKKDMKKLAMQVQGIITEVNRLSVVEQRKELEKLAPELLEEKPKEKQDLKPLPNAEGSIVFRVAPEPSKYLHVGHALVFMIQNLYVKKHNGKLNLRIEDTNPEKSDEEFLNAMKEDLAWLGLTFDKEIVVSDHLEIFYTYSEKLIKTGGAYVCSCSQEDMKTLRMQKRACPCRKNNNMDEWKNMLAGSYKDGERIVRLVGDMESNNGVLRDPVIFRISSAPHYKQGTKYRVWPTYDFENAVADAHWKTTHVIRSKEFELREPLQQIIRERLGLKGPTTLEIGRFRISGAETQGRVIRAMIEKKEVTGWDDPRLVTVQAIRRRGFVKEMIEELALVVGLGKAGGAIDFKTLEGINRKIVDPIAPRYFFVKDPVLVTIDNAPEKTVELDLHPDAKKGGRRMKTTSAFMLDKKDVDRLNAGEEYRLMDCLNFKKDGTKYAFTSEKNSNFTGKQRVHWLPARENAKASVMMPDGSMVYGLVEKGVASLKEGDILQFERFGFCRLDNKKELHFRFTHS